MRHKIARWRRQGNVHEWEKLANNLDWYSCGIIPLYFIHTQGSPSQTGPAFYQWNNLYGALTGNLRRTYPIYPAETFSSTTQKSKGGHDTNFVVTVGRLWHAVPPMTTKFASWQLSVFSVVYTKLSEDKTLRWTGVASSASVFLYMWTWVPPGQFVDLRH